jgi:hypothetical protein
MGNLAAVSTSAPSGTLDELAAVVGRAGAKAMCCMWGGQRLYVPKQPRGALVELLGELLADRLAREFGGDYLDLPQPDIAAARRIEAQRLRNERFTLNEIATRLGVGQRRVRQILAGE